MLKFVTTFPHKTVDKNDNFCFCTKKISHVISYYYYS